MEVFSSAMPLDKNPRVSADKFKKRHIVASSVWPEVDLTITVTSDLVNPVEVSTTSYYVPRRMTLMIKFWLRLMVLTILTIVRIT